MRNGLIDQFAFEIKFIVYYRNGTEEEYDIRGNKKRKEVCNSIA